MSAAVRTKTRFLAAASDELRQPMCALELFLEALRPSLEDDEREAILTKVCAAAGAMSELLSSMLNLSAAPKRVVESVK